MVSIELTPLDATLSNPMLILAPPAYDSSKTPVIFGGGGSPISLQYILATSGTWTFGAGTHDLSARGRYSVRLWCSANPYPAEPQNCVPQYITGCPTSMWWYQTASGCRFEGGGGPYQYMEFAAKAAGDNYMFSVSSSDFSPGVGVYSASGGKALQYVYANPGVYSTSLYFVAPSAGKYIVLTNARTDNAVGFFALDTTCSSTCVVPKVTTQPLSQHVPFGGSVTLSVAASGSGTLHYAWYAGYDPPNSPVPLGTDSPTLTLSNLRQSLDVNVQVTGSCGTVFSDQAHISVDPTANACTPSATAACLLSGRFRATVRYRGAFDNGFADTDALVKTVSGFSDPSYETAFFYFNDTNNVELMLKMLDQGNTNSGGQATIAVLFGSATPLRTEMMITDTKTGTVKSYTSAFGGQAGSTDFTAFVK